MEQEILDELKSMNKKLDVLIGLAKKGGSSPVETAAWQTGDEIRKQVEQRIAKAKQEAMSKINLPGA